VAKKAAVEAEKSLALSLRHDGHNDETTQLPFPCFKPIHYIPTQASSNCECANK